MIPCAAVTAAGDGRGRSQNAWLYCRRRCPRPGSWEGARQNSWKPWIQIQIQSMTHAFALAVSQFWPAWLIWIMINMRIKIVCILWAMARGNCNLVWSKISPDTTCLINNLILPTPPARTVYQMVADRNWRLVDGANKGPKGFVPSLVISGSRYYSC